MDINYTNVNYGEIFNQAKDSTVRAHAMTWIKHIVDDKKLAECEKFREIEKVVSEARIHIKE